MSVRIKGITLRRRPQKELPFLPILSHEEGAIAPSRATVARATVAVFSRCTGAACWGLRFFLVMVCVSPHLV
nr:hypothetical protein [Planktothrix agardhii]